MDAPLPASLSSLSARQTPQPPHFPATLQGLDKLLERQISIRDTLRSMAHEICGTQFDGGASVAAPQSSPRAVEPHAVAVSLKLDILHQIQLQIEDALMALRTLV